MALELYHENKYQIKERLQELLTKVEGDFPSVSIVKFGL